MRTAKEKKMEVIDDGLPVEEKVNYGQPPVVDVSRDQVLAEINKQENPEPEIPEVTPTPAPAPVEQSRQAIEPVQPSGEAKKTDNNPQPVAAPTTGEPPKTETPLLTEQQVQELLEKKHVPPQDTWKLAKIYMDAQKKISQQGQELSALRKVVPTEQPIMAPVQNVSPITNLPYTSSDPNAQLLEDLQQNPIMTLRKIAEVAYGSQVNQLAESLNEQKLHNTVVRLSTSPETAEFNLPVVQEEIKAIMAERPELANNMADNLPILNDLAIGRLYRAGKLNKDAVEAGKKIAEQNLANRQSVPMETTGKPAVSVEKQYKDMSLAEQRAFLLSQMAKSE
jgi:hypothetical protein